MDCMRTGPCAEYRDVIVGGSLNQGALPLHTPTVSPLHAPVPMHPSVQDVVIVGLIMKHLKMSMAVMAASAAAFVAFLAWLYGGGASIEVLSALQVRGEQPVSCPNPGLNHHRRREGTGIVYSLGTINCHTQNPAWTGVPAPLLISQLFCGSDCSRGLLPFTRQPVPLPWASPEEPSLMFVGPACFSVAVEQHPGRHLRHEAAPDLAQH